MTEMYTHTFDTHKYIKELQGTGFNEAQAEVIVKSLLESREYDFSKLATREQVKMLEASTREQVKMLEASINNLRNEFKSETDSIRNEMKSEIANAQLNILKWMIPFLITIIGMIIGVLIKLV